MRHVSVQQLSAFLDGALVGVSRELVTRHLASCASCRERHAGWRASDDALRRVLAWEPEARTFEEWSSRVELTIMAERKGLPPPAFSDFQHPVIAEPDAERLDIVVQSVRRTRRGLPAPAPPEPGRPGNAPEPTRTEPAPEPVASSAPADAEPIAPADAEPVAPTPAEEEPATRASEPPSPEPRIVPAIASAIDPPTAAPPGEAAPPPTPLVESRPWSEVVLPPIERAPVRVVNTRVHDPGPPAERVPDPLPRARRVVPVATRTWAPTPPIVSPAQPRRHSERHVLLGVLSVLLLLVVAGSPLVPEVIRIPLPDWRWRLPRVEFVRRGHSEPIPTRSSIPPMRLATRSVIEPELVKPEPIPAPVESAAVVAHPLSPEPSPIASEVASGTVHEPGVATPPGSEPVAYAPITEPARPAARPAKPAPARAKPVRSAPTRPTPEPAPPVTYGSESPGTIVPTRVTTTVEPVREPTKPVNPQAPAAPESEEDWPLLCGTVVDAAGVPVEGARVVLAGNTLAVRTDRRGRFCVACPPGTQGLRVEAAGHAPQSRTVELSSGMVEIRVSLAAAR